MSTDRVLETYQKHPLKLYIQDIYRANRTTNKYIYELFGRTFKNVMIHGLVTSIYNKTNRVANLEISDPTGTIQIFYDVNKSNKHLANDVIKELYADFAKGVQSGDENIDVMSKLLTCVENKHKTEIDFEEGSYVRVIGDIFMDDIRQKRMVSAFECNKTCVAADYVWLEELRYLYEKFYLWDKTS